MGLKLSTLFSKFFFFISSKFSLVHTSKLSLGKVSLTAMKGVEVFMPSVILNGRNSLSVIVKKVIVVGMIFLGYGINMNCEPPIVVFFFHANQLAVAVNFGIRLNDVPWFNRLTFVFHLEIVSQTFWEKSTGFPKFFQNSQLDIRYLKISTQNKMGSPTKIKVINPITIFCGILYFLLSI